MAKSTVDGTLLYLEFNSVVIDTDYREFDPAIDEVQVDSTAGADPLESMHHIRDTVGPTGSFLVQNDTAGKAIVAALKMGATGNLIWGLLGNTAGLAKWGIEARVKTSNVAASYDSELILDVEWVNTGRDWLYDGRTATF